ncbi:hypothetical protein [Dendronalium sp. ChiSLP03b]|uniref:hypothetical protein n=1 Tax=Dendronalium sp. ChiSLP03b TaxID=3075381 RepID=UPI00391878D0
MTANLVIVSPSEIGGKLPKLAFHQHQKNIPKPDIARIANQCKLSIKHNLPHAIALLKEQV